MEKIKLDQRKLILQLPLHQQFEVYCQHREGVLLVHKLADRNENDFPLLVNVGSVLCQDRKRVEVLPKLHEKDVNFRQKVLPGVRMNKNPDLRINGEYWEVESPEWPYRKSAVSNRIRRDRNKLTT